MERWHPSPSTIHPALGAFPIPPLPTRLPSCPEAFRMRLHLSIWPHASFCSNLPLSILPASVSEPALIISSGIYPTFPPSWPPGLCSYFFLTQFSTLSHLSKCTSGCVTSLLQIFPRVC